jgi:formamidopyrimidine-DNA glycosylase
MPELPEVETIKKDLEPLIKGSVIDSVDFLWHKTLRGEDFKDFDRDVAGQRVTGLSRRGKYLIVELQNGKLLLVHFKMTGSFLIVNGDVAPSKHTRAVVCLKDGRKMLFIDPRKFGRFQLVDPGEGPLAELGVEPLSKDFTAGRLKELLAKRKLPIKLALLDQSMIAGIGNMYADEALFLAGVHPLRAADSLSAVETERLYRAIPEVLKEAIRNKGASIVNYFRPGGETGTAHSNFKVAHRKGGCTACPGGVERIAVRGRGTYFCPSCQH